MEQVQKIMELAQDYRSAIISNFLSQRGEKADSADIAKEIVLSFLRANHREHDLLQYVCLRKMVATPPLAIPKHQEIHMELVKAGLELDKQLTEAKSVLQTETQQVITEELAKTA